MGSGAFLVQVCRFLSERLVEAWEETERQHPGAPGVTPEGAVSTGSLDEQLIPKDTEERLALARRLVADRCLYGVDKNHLAVEMAKLSLWLITLQKDRPFTFLDHALKCGDSLLGITSTEQIEWVHLDPQKGRQLPFWAALCAPALRTAVEKRRQLESFTVETIAHAEQKARLLREAEAALNVVGLIGDLIVGSGLSTAGKKTSALDERLERIGALLNTTLSPATPVAEREQRVLALRERARAMLGTAGGSPRVPFHWALEFPEVFDPAMNERGGFNAIVSNPPFLGGQKITGVLGTDYRSSLVTHLAHGQRGSADLCAYFFLRARQLLCDGGGFGMLATNTIAQGDTREVGLEQLARDGDAIPRAVSSGKWPGTANLEVAQVWVHRGSWNGEYALDGCSVASITPFLTPPGALSGKPYRLAANAEKSFQGSIVLGMGFLLEPREVEALIARDERNRDVLYPYLNGEDLNSRFDQSSSRWVINFRDWPLRRGAHGLWRGADDKQRIEWLRVGVVPDDYPDPVAADYADCLKIVEEKVRPEREQINDKTSRRLWWRFLRPRPELHAAIAGMERVLVVARTAKYRGYSFVPANQVLDANLVVFSFGSPGFMSLLQSDAHEAWVNSTSSTLETRQGYRPSDCFETFPFPDSTIGLDAIGDRYHAHRRSIMLIRKQGLTKTYNRFHNPRETAPDIRELRELHLEIDRAVAAAYGWIDLDLGHGFHDTKQGVRFTIRESARQEVLVRLLRLNHASYADEVRQGLHEPKGRPTRRGTEPGSNAQFDLPDPGGR
jgi:hypothetical protein